MHRFALSLLCLLSVTLTAPAEEQTLDNLLDQLDQSMANMPAYVNEREQRITNLKQQLANRPSAAKADCYLKLYEEYKSFQNDSALQCLQRSLDIALRENNRPLIARCRSLILYQSSRSGFFSDAQALFDRINPLDLDAQGRSDYYYAAQHLFGEMGYFTHLPDLKEEYNRLCNLYRDSVLLNCSDNEYAYFKIKTVLLLAEGKHDEAFALNDRWLKATTDDDSHLAEVDYYRHVIYENMGNHEESMKWLVRSATADIRHAIFDQASLWNLAERLADEGQLERSQRYITEAWHYAQAYGTRMRTLFITPILNNIDARYQHSINQHNQQLRLLVCAVSVLALLLVVALLLLNRERLKTAAAKNSLKKSNKELKDTVEQLNQTNKSLNEANEQVRLTNQQLNDSNRLKEEYIGHFIGTCSLYIDKQEELRKRVNKLLRNRQYQELHELTKNTDNKDKELDELNARFDATFLHLFPTFVDDFNALLEESSRFRLPNAKQLNTTLRIFALIRLGIDDSTRIAEFLHCSPNTVYNYRTRMRNAALGTREEFESKVKRV